MRDTLVPRGRHPWWCEFVDGCDGEHGRDPRHIGRTSTLYAQGEEARFKLQLVRSDNDVPAGTWAGEVLVALTANEGYQEVAVHMSADEARALQLVLGQYVWFAEREGRHPSMGDEAAKVKAEMWS